MKRIAQLDGVRGIAILLVLVWHYGVCQIVTESNTFAGYCKAALSLTWSGVDLFFVLSGFLIVGILLDHRDSPNYFQTFYLRRVCRIFPLYFLLLGAFVCLTAWPLFTRPCFQVLFNAPMPIWSYVTFTQNFFMGYRGTFGAHWLGVTWSLAVEEQFYLLVPFFIYALPIRALVYLLSLAIAASPLARYLFGGADAFMTWRYDSLLTGALLALLVRQPAFLSAVRQHKRFVIYLLVFFLVGTALMAFLPGIFGVFQYLWLAGFYSTFLLIVFLDSETILRRILGSAVLVWFGQLSYGIYLFHEAVNGLLHGFLRDSTPRLQTFSDAGISLLALLLTLGLATLSYRFLETPFLKIGHKFQY